MNEQPEALRLADELENGEYFDVGSTGVAYGWMHDDPTASESAAELRRLHKENELLRDAVAAERVACAMVCEKMADNIYSNSHEDSQPMPHAVAKFCAAAIRARGER
jgi:hypothetical protein